MPASVSIKSSMASFFVMLDPTLEPIAEPTKPPSSKAISDSVSESVTPLPATPPIRAAAPTALSPSMVTLLISIIFPTIT